MISLFSQTSLLNAVANSWEKEEGPDENWKYLWWTGLCFSKDNLANLKSEKCA